jgi:hypothetical protein
MDRWTRLEGGIAVVRDLRSSHDQVAGDLLERRGLYRRHCQGVDARVRRSTRQYCRGVERIRVSPRAATLFPLAASYRFCGD